MEPLAIAQWLATIATAIAAVPGVLAFLELKNMKHLKVEAVYAPTYQDKTFPDKFFLILNITPGAKDTVIRSVSLEGGALRLVSPLSEGFLKDGDRLSPAGDVTESECTVFTIIPSRSSSNLNWSMAFLCQSRCHLNTSSLCLKISSEHSLLKFIKFTKTHKLKIRLTMNNERIKRPHAEALI